MIKFSQRAAAEEILPPFSFLKVARAPNLR
jgi:hypothetical protein